MRAYFLMAGKQTDPVAIEWSR